MWEILLFVIGAFVGGWSVRGIFDHRSTRSQQIEDPEMMWFNKQKSQWERVTKMQLLVSDRVVVAVPIKLVEERRNKEFILP